MQCPEQNSQCGERHRKMSLTRALDRKAVTLVQGGDLLDDPHERRLRRGQMAIPTAPRIDPIRRSDKTERFVLVADVQMAEHFRKVAIVRQADNRWSE